MVSEIVCAANCTGIRRHNRTCGQHLNVYCVSKIALQIAHQQCGLPVAKGMQVW
jgi:hypothetical protein